MPLIRDLLISEGIYFFINIDLKIIIIDIGRYDQSCYTMVIKERPVHNRKAAGVRYIDMAVQ